MAPNKDRASDLSDGHGIRCFADDRGNLSHIETGKPIASRSKTESPVKYRSDIDGPRALERLVKRGLKVVVMGPIVEYDRALSRLLVDSLRWGDEHFADSRGTAGVLEVDRRLRDLVAAKGARYVSVYDAVCGHGPCETFAEGDVPLQFEAGHLTARARSRSPVNSSKIAPCREPASGMSISRRQVVIRDARSD
jgi:hypothetical protein